MRIGRLKREAREPLVISSFQKLNGTFIERVGIPLIEKKGHLNVLYISMYCSNKIMKETHLYKDFF